MVIPRQISSQWNKNILSGWKEDDDGAVDPLACLNLIFGNVKISNICTNSTIFKCHIILELAIQNLIQI